MCDDLKYVCICKKISCMEKVFQWRQQDYSRKAHTILFLYLYLLTLTLTFFHEIFILFGPWNEMQYISLSLSLSLSLSSSESCWNSFIMHVSKLWVRIDMYISIRMPTLDDYIIPMFNFNIINSYAFYSTWSRIEPLSWWHAN